MKQYAIPIISMLLLGCSQVAVVGRKPEGPAPGSTPLIISDDGGWCWFESPRAMIRGDKLIIGSVASGWRDPSRKGDVEVIVHDMKGSKASTFELYDQLQLDDHDSPAILPRSDGRYLALFAKHNNENHFYYRISEPDDPLHWGEVQTFIPTPQTQLTYSNLFQLTAEKGRIYDFYRGLDNSFKPSFAYSDDLGATWTSGSVFIRVPSTQRHRPYVVYASNGTAAVHMLYTEAHPRDYDNSLYHVYYKDGQLHHTDGTPIRSLQEGLNSPDEGTRIFKGDPQHVAWCTNIVLDAQQRPVVVYSVQVGGAGLPQGQGGDDLRYRYARWDGKVWQDNALACAGTRLYAGEDDYSGLAAIEPDDPNVVYISTNSDPVTCSPLISEADGLRHYELFRGVTTDGGKNWHWTPITRNSVLDNLRPIRPPSDNRARALIWLRGKYRAYTDYQQQVMGLFWEK